MRNDRSTIFSNSISFVLDSIYKRLNKSEIPTGWKEWSDGKRKITFTRKW